MLLSGGEHAGQNVMEVDELKFPTLNAFYAKENKREFPDRALF